MKKIYKLHTYLNTEAGKKHIESFKGLIPLSGIMLNADDIRLLHLNSFTYLIEEYSSVTSLILQSFSKLKRENTEDDESEEDMEEFGHERKAPRFIEFIPHEKIAETLLSMKAVAAQGLADEFIIGYKVLKHSCDSKEVYVPEIRCRNKSGAYELCAGFVDTGTENCLAFVLAMPKIEISI